MQYCMQMQHSNSLSNSCTACDAGVLQLQVSGDISARFQVGTAYLQVQLRGSQHVGTVPDSRLDLVLGLTDWGTYHSQLTSFVSLGQFKEHI